MQGKSKIFDLDGCFLFLVLLSVISRSSLGGWVGTDDAIFRLSPNDLRWCYLRGLECPSFAGLQGLVL